MAKVIRLILLFILFLTSQSGIAATTEFTVHQYDVNHIAQSDEIYGYDTNINLRHCCHILLTPNTQDWSFLAFVSDFLAAKRARGLETRGIRPEPGTRTIQGQVDAATQAGNPTVQRGRRDLFRLRSSGHGQGGATATPQNVRNVVPDGVHMGNGPDRAVTRRDIRELYKAQTGHGTSSIRTRSGR